MAGRTLALLPDRLAVCRLAADDDVPTWAWSAASIVSVTRTTDELSIVCPSAVVPAGVRSEPGWRAFRVDGPLDFSLVVVVSSLTAPLAEAGVSVFVVSTFDTDWVLVRDDDVEEAIHALVHAGHVVLA